MLIRQLPWQEKVGSLFIPQGHREGYEDRGVVVAVGQKCDLDIQPGDKVIFKRMPATGLVPDWREGDPYDWKDLLCLKPDPKTGEHPILAVYEDQVPVPV